MAVKTLLLGFVALLLNAVATVAAEIDITLEPVQPAPSEITVIRSGGTLIPVPQSAPVTASVAYSVSLPDDTPPSAPYNYTIIARWPDANEQVYLRLADDTPKIIPIRIFHKQPPANDTSVRRYRALGTDFMSAFEAYFVCRYIYRTLPDAAVEPKSHALRCWYDNAFSLARDYDYIAADPEVRQLAAATGDPYYVGMNKQFAALEWRTFGLVRQLLEQGEYQRAQALNTNFLEKYKTADTAAVAAAQLQGITKGLLEGNDAYLSQLVR